MKEHIFIILIGSASFSQTSGQIMNYSELINSNVTIIAVDPEHAKETDESLQLRSGLEISRGKIVKGHLNIFHQSSDKFFRNFIPNKSAYYLILSFTGIEKELPSFEIANRLGIGSRFWNIKKAFCISFGCLSNPPNILDLLLKLNLNPFGNFTINHFLKTIHELNQLQEYYYAKQNNIDALSRAFTNENMPDWAENSMKKLKLININTLEEAHNKYLQFANINIKKEINYELKKLGIFNFFDERPNDFTVRQS